MVIYETSHDYYDILAVLLIMSRILKSIRACFQVFEMEVDYLDVGNVTSGTCSQSSARLELGHMTSNDVIIKDTICGTSRPEYTYKLQSDSVYVRLFTDGSGGQGFVFTYKWTMDHLIGERLKVTLYNQLLGVGEKIPLISA